MSKPDWSKSPTWANYLLHDAVNGDWSWWENEPRYCDDCDDWHEDPKLDGLTEDAGPRSTDDEFWGVQKRPCPLSNGVKA